MGIRDAATWRPPGLAGVWPADEYLFDGGDHPPSVEVMPDWTVLGLDLEDTVAHYDTLDGRTEVQASNRVPIYAPRFASVRHIAGLSMSHNRFRVAGVDSPTGPVTQEDQQLATTVHQPVQTERYLGIRGLQDFRERAGTLGVTGDVLLGGLRDRFQTHEDFQVIRDGTFDNSEKARLAIWLAAAAAWESDQSAQVMLDEHAAVQVTGRSRAQSVYEYELPEGKPRLRIIGELRIQTICLMILTAIASVGVLYWLRPVLVPFVLSVFLVCGIAPLLDLIQQRLRAPRVAAVAITFLMGIALMAMLWTVIWLSVASLMQDADIYRKRFVQLARGSPR
jgi:hypothetical protein